MTRLFKSALLATLILLSIFSVACTREVPVAVPAPTVTCSPGPIPVFPSLPTVEKCSEGEVQLVCMSPGDAAAIWSWAREMGRWSERAQVCTDLADSPLPAQVTLHATFAQLAKLAAKLSDPRVHIEVEVKTCGQENAFYYPDTRTITFCTEMMKYGGAARFFLAHEIAHAYIVQLDLPFTGSHEAAADELASYLLIKAGMAKDVRAAGRYWREQAVLSNVPGYADHPDHDQRGWTMSCLADEALKVPTSIFCRGDLARVQHNWARILK